jgi:cytochrome oxidase assembly protein ShyY1
VGHSEARGYTSAWRYATFSIRSLSLTLLALLLISACFSLSNWQWHKKVTRDAFNNTLSIRQKAPAIDLAMTPIPIESWRTYNLTVSNLEISVVRSRYWQSQYGFAVIARGKTESNQPIWLDLGWISAGSDAKDIPDITFKPNKINIQSRARQGNMSDFGGPSGSFFGSSTQANNNVRKFIDAAGGLGFWNSYFEVRKSLQVTANYPKEGLKEVELKPQEEPKIDSGPHAAYAVQWILFGCLIALGRVLIFRQDLIETRKRLTLE